MKIVPVRQYAEPKFPTRDEFSEHPELLSRLPRRWQRHAAIASVVATACSASLLLSSCRNQQENVSAPAAKPAPVQLTQNPTGKVAPIFQHGGIGDFRGMFATMPVPSSYNVFLPEDEARQVIIEEFIKAGISMQPDQPTIPDVRMERRMDIDGKPVVEGKPLVLDGENPKRHIAYEFLSWSDIEEIGLKHSRYGTMQAIAGLTRHALAEAEPSDTIGVFYDPAPLVGRNYQTLTPGLNPANSFSDTTLAPLGFFNGEDNGKYPQPLPPPVQPDGSPSPLRPATCVVDQQYGTITIDVDNNQLVLRTGSTTATLDGKDFTLPCPVVTRHGTVYFPLRPVAKALGCTVTWNGQAKKVTVKHASFNWDRSSRVMQNAQQQTLAFLNCDRDALAREFSRESIRSQVKDFVDWLKAEGMI
ncbi:MAG: copper amine oxidase N-terminal domain-containing protein [Armatimonadota bacterium]